MDKVEKLIDSKMSEADDLDSHCTCYEEDKAIAELEKSYNTVNEQVHFFDEPELHWIKLLLDSIKRFLDTLPG